MIPAKHFVAILRKQASLLLPFIAVLAFTGLAAPASARELPVRKPVIECKNLAETDIAPPGEAPARIVTARLVANGAAAPYCEIKGYVAPQVHFELRLPSENWTQRLMYSGCGGYCGRVDFRLRASEDCTAIANGELALVASDLGHDAPDGNGDAVWAANNRQGKIDYGYRGVHVVTVAAKAIIARYYGQAQQYAYFNGCSDGGREGMMEVQRFPADFNGVVAGAPVIYDTLNNSLFHTWTARHLINRAGGAMFSSADLEVLHQAALDACDMVGDGIKDGVIGNPRACRFDPAVTLCPDPSTGKCLNREQIDAARAIYTGPVDAAGAPFYFGRPVGSELGWIWGDIGGMAGAFIRYMSSDQIQPFALDQVTFDQASADRFNELASIYNATNPDISAFQQAGGKLIMWHGWGDPAVPPMGSVTYYEALQHKFGDRTASFARLFMLPGVSHCGTGEGPDRINMLDAIMTWVEDGTAPTAIQAMRKVYGRTLQTRPVYPFPQNARFTGKGSPDQAAAFAPSRVN